MHRRLLLAAFCLLAGLSIAQEETEPEEVFKVQIRAIPERFGEEVAYRAKKVAEEEIGLEIHIVHKDGYFKLRLGEMFATRKESQEQCNEIKANTEYKDAFIVIEKPTVQEAKSMILRAKIGPEKKIAWLTVLVIFVVLCIILSYWNSSLRKKVKKPQGLEEKLTNSSRKNAKLEEEKKPSEERSELREIRKKLKSNLNCQKCGASIIKDGILTCHRCHEHIKMASSQDVKIDEQGRWKCQKCLEHGKNPKTLAIGDKIKCRRCSTENSLI